MFKRFASAVAAIIASGAIAMAASIPLLPSTPQYSEPSQIQATINAVIQMLNGNGTYATAPATVSIGPSCVGTSATTTIVCNGQRGTVSVTGTGLATQATGAVQTVTITNSAVTATSVCHIQQMSAGTAGSGVAVATVVPTAGSLAVILVNAGTTTNSVQTGTFGFYCFN